jgi:hypothetical protein
VSCYLDGLRESGQTAREAVNFNGCNLLLDAFVEMWRREEGRGSPQYDFLCWDVQTRQEG